MEKSVAATSVLQAIPIRCGQDHNRCFVVVGCLFFVWHAFKGKTTTDRAAHVSMAMGLVALILAISLTIFGLGYEHHTLKILVLIILYLAVPYFIWPTYKQYRLAKGYG
jgi:hypothetical protein